jgi:diguanylate cyclase (GGDEF)-like protein
MTRSTSKDATAWCIEFLDACIKTNPSDEVVGLLLGQLDDFNRITTTFGHESSNSFVARYLDSLQLALPEGASLIRFSDRRFAVVVRKQSLSDVMSVAELVTEEQLPEMIFEGERLQVDVTVGVAMHPVHADDGSNLLRRAELALGTAKQKEFPFDIYRANATHQVQSLWKLESELEAAIAKGGLDVHFQPQVEIISGEPVGLEALCRWRTQSGMVQPDSFIPIAERTGAIVPMTWLIFDRVQEAAAFWGRMQEPMSLSVNVTPQVMEDKEFYERVTVLRNHLSETNLTLTIEVTEDSLLQGGVKLDKALHRLREEGVDIALDDFGKGYSSLSHLKNIPASEIKIDKQFVGTLCTDLSDRQIVKAVTELSHGLGMSVVAEGVDSVEVLGVLSELGCDRAQGFYLARAMAPEHMLAWLNAFRQRPPAPWADIESECPNPEEVVSRAIVPPAG